MSAFDSSCSLMCAVQPVTRLATNSGVPSLILVTHHIEEIMPAFENVLVMREGAIAARGATKDVLDEESLSALYGVRIKDVVHRDGRLWPMF